MEYPDFSLLFTLTTDGSLHGLGAVLNQKQGGTERLIAYASCRPRGSEKKDKYYSAFKLELLALKSAITEKFGDYLLPITLSKYSNLEERLTSFGWHSWLSIILTCATSQGDRIPMRLSSPESCERKDPSRMNEF